MAVAALCRALHPHCAASSCPQSLATQVLFERNRQTATDKANKTGADTHDDDSSATRLRRPFLLLRVRATLMQTTPCAVQALLL